MSGGYVVLREPMLRTWVYKHTADHPEHISSATLEALNTIQATPWQINQETFKLLHALREQGDDLTYKQDGHDTLVTRLAPPDRPEVQRLPEPVWASMTKEDRSARNQQVARRMKQYDAACSEQLEADSIYYTASKVADRDAIWYPHNMDFRTRIYPIPTALHPQGSSLARSMLRFARPMALGAEGFYWLTVAVANAAGMDKLSFEERIAWVLDNEDIIAGCALDPVRNREWLALDDPWMFAALAPEYWRAAQRDDPENYPSQIPVHLDGTCNGAQHLSLMSRDIVGAEATNCRNTGVRNDLYLDVALRVRERIHRDAAQGHELAYELTPQVQEDGKARSLVKRSVMTVPYGVTEYGVADFMIKDGHVKGMSQEWAAATYLRDCIWESLDQTMAKGRELQAWIGTCAMMVAEAGLPLRWETPAGSTVTQAYRNLRVRRIRTAHGSYTSIEEPEPGTDLGMNVVKSRNAASPNVVHSCDASHLQLSVNRLSQMGVRDFSMVHDSYGVHACNVGIMRDVLRDVVYDMYRDNYLETWRRSVMAKADMTVPAPPSLGSYDITEIREAEYFFS